MGTCIVYDPADGTILCAFLGRQKNEAAHAGNWANWPDSMRLWIEGAIDIAGIDRTHQVVNGELVQRAEPLPAPEPEPTTADLLADLVETLDKEGVLSKTKLPQRAQDKIAVIAAK